MEKKLRSELKENGLSTLEIECLSILASRLESIFSESDYGGETIGRHLLSALEWKVMVSILKGKSIK